MLPAGLRQPGGCGPFCETELEQAGLVSLYEEMELPVLTVLAAMEFQGIMVDTEFLYTFGHDTGKGDSQIRRGKFLQLAGKCFLINSPQQLATVLFDRLQLPTKKKTRGRTAYSTDNEVLTALAGEHPIAAKVIDYRTLGKLKSTYVDGLRKQVNPCTGRVHTTFVQSATATGRLSSRDPNLQNIPVRGEQGGPDSTGFCG